MTAPLRRGLAALALLLLVAPALLRADDASPYGLNVHAPGGATLVRQFDAVQHAGVGWVRVDFVWASIERQRGVYDWSAYDAIVQAAQKRGLSVLGILAYSPAWATDGPELTGVPRDAGDWQAFVGKAAKRYAGRVGAWEMWNEPNLTEFWAGTRQEYWDVVLRPGADAVHAADPAAKVAGPALAHLQSADWSHWLLDTLKNAGDHLDVVTHHLYDVDGYGDVTKKLTGSTQFASQPQYWNAVPPSVREVLKEANARSKPFWLTETGWESGAAGGETAQAANYSGLLGDWLTGNSDRSWIQKIFFYELEDAPGDITWGVLRNDHTTKPAYGALADFIAAHAPPPPPPPPPPQSTELLLLDGRFGVQATWRTADGQTGAGTPLPFSRETGRFWFFTPGNTELLVKVLDGGNLNQHAWVYWGALSDVEYWITVTDHQTGKTKQYHNPPGTFCGGADVNAFPLQSATPASLFALPDELTAGAAASSTCASNAQTLCLGEGGRFKVQARWNAGGGWTGNAQAVSADSESGSFWFFAQSNLELSVKVLDGRALNGKFWVYFGALSDVEYWVTVTDTQTGRARTYHNAPGTLCGKADTAAFAG